MKNIFKYLFFALLPFTFWACEDEDTIRIPDTAEGATMRIQVDAAKSFWNFAEISTAEVEYSLFTVNNNIQSVDLYMVYTPVGGTASDRLLFQQYTQASFDAEGAIRGVTITSADLASFLNAQGITQADGDAILNLDSLGGGDRIDIINITTLTDGRVFPDTVLVGTPNQNLNVTPNAVNAAGTTSFSVGFTAYIACPTDQTLWEGNYNTFAINVDNFCGFLDCSTSREATISFIGAPEPFRYGTTTHDGGLWGSADPTSLDRASNFYDICGNPLFLPGPTGYGDHEDLGTSTRDAATGVIVFRWCNFFNPVCGETIFEPIP